MDYSTSQVGLSLLIDTAQPTIIKLTVPAQLRAHIHHGWPADSGQGNAG